MRICHVVEAGGGCGRIVVNLLREQARQGRDVTLIYSPERAEADFLEQIAAIPHLRIAPVTMTRGVGFHDARHGYHLYKTLRRLGPFDILHSHSSKAGALTRMAGIFLPDTIQIYTPHAFITMDRQASRAYGLIEYMLSFLCDRIIAVSAQEKQHAVELGIAAGKVQTIPNGIDLELPDDRAAARRKMGFAAGDFIVGCVGRLVAQKNPRRAVAAFALLAAQYPQARLAIIGSGPLQAEMKHLLAGHNLTQRARFFGSVGARELMCGFDALLCASDYEGFPVVFAEALAAGAPIVTTPVGGSAEAVLPAQTGFVAMNFDPAELAAGLTRLIEMSDGERETFASRARAHARNFSIQIMNDRIVNLYHESAGARSALVPI